MPRADAIGFFWEDRPVEKAPKAEKIKRTPPDRFWERPDYLPGLEEALAFNVPLFEDWELAVAAAKGERLLYDIECYENYFLVAFMSLTSGKVIYFEKTGNQDFNYEKLRWVLQAFCLISFNGLNYDEPMLALALAGKSNQQLKWATNAIIEQQQRPRDVLRNLKVKPLKLNHIDLIEVAPLSASLKIYGGRLHSPKMQDLPFPPSTVLNFQQIAIVRFYCVNDLVNTEYLARSLKKQVELREVMSNEYGIDLRSKSDAQVAEAVISQGITQLTGRRIEKPTIIPGTSYRYKVPNFIKYQSPLMNWALDLVRQAWFIVGDNGRVQMPEELATLEIAMGGSVYRMGIGGLHSSEQSTAHYADENTILKDIDATSYYPYIILLLGLYPSHLGKNFLKIYKQLVDRRVAAKRAGDKTTADSLKITINGSFGKLGNKYSAVYSPDLLIQVTVTGQLSFLMLIERFELAGISVVSANTDGIVAKCPKHLESTMDSIVKQWEQDTGFETEDAEYLALFSRDVNNYIAIKKQYDKDNKQWLMAPGDVKTKGAYSIPEEPAQRLHKNPTNEICVEAVVAYLTKGIPLMTTIKACTDICNFVSVRTVKGGAVKGDQFLGKAIRWYYAKGEEGEIVYADSGNKVPRSEGAKPLMQIPQQFPDDVDYDWYLQEALRMLVGIGFLDKESIPKNNCEKDEESV